MEDIKIRYCKLCLTNIGEENDFLLLKQELDDMRKHAICNVCSTKLFAAKEFRLTCLCTNNVINPYIDNATKSPVDLRGIYVKKRTNGQISDDIKICCLCMQPINNVLEYESVNQEKVDMIQKLVPEMNIFTIKDPVMCKLCLDSLTTHCNFLKQCSDAGQDIGNIFNGRDLDAPSPVPSLDLFLKVEHVDVEFEEDVPELINTECLDTNCEGIESSVSKVNGQDLSSFEEHKNSLKTFKCEECYYRCKLKSNLKKHMLIHKDPSEVEMYKCETCNYETKYKKCIKRHLLTHKDISEVQTYKCEICNYETKYKEVLKSHMLVHKDPSEVRMYKCEHCNYETRRKKNLTDHMLVHKDPSEVQMYKCDKCAYQSNLKSTLKTHMLRHKDPSEVQMYQCEICNYRTKHRRNVKRHMLIHRDVNMTV